jgi:hypothetical protein
VPDRAGNEGLALFAEKGVLCEQFLQRMCEELMRRNYAQSTMRSYLWIVREFQRYLGRYTHRVAISNHRLLAFDRERVSFRWKDRVMALSAQEFLRRYLQHVLPHGFVRIRQFGFLANSQRGFALTLIRQLIGNLPQAPSADNRSEPAVWRCPRSSRPMRIGPPLSAIILRSLCRVLDSS